MKNLSKKNLKNVLMALFTGLVFCIVFIGCSKDKNNGEPSGNADEAAAARVVGTYKGTIDATNANAQYFDAIIIITKESGNRVKITAKPGEAYSGMTPKIIPIQGILESDDATSEGPQGILIYQAQEKTLKFLSKATSAEDATYSFEGTKQ